MPDSSVDNALSRLLRRRYAVSVLLVLLTFAVYANSFPGAFIQDDIHIVDKNPLVQSFDLGKIFTSDYWVGVENSGLYRPLTIFSLALNRLVTGVEPWGFHLVNVLLHAVVTLLVWLTLPLCGASRLAALMAAVLFALHPIHAEVVNEAVGRSELLVAGFLLTAIYSSRSQWRWRTLVVVGSFALALLSKEHAIVLLALLPLLDLHREGPSSLRGHWPQYAGLLIVAIGWLLLRHFGVEHAAPRSPYSLVAVPLAHVPWDDRILTALLYQWVYLGKLLVPLELHAVYSLPDLPEVIEAFWSPRGLVVVVVTLSAAVGVVNGWRRRQWWSLPAAAYVVSFAPTANVVMPIGVTMAERLAYFPSVWFCAALGWLLAEGLSRDLRWRRFFAVLACAYLMFLGGRLGLRNRDFVSEIALWQREIVTNSADYLGWQSYAESLNASHRYGEADQAYQHLLQMQPEFQGGRRSYFAFLFERGRYLEAIKLGEGTLILARRQGDVVGVSYDLLNLATAYLELQDYARALTYLEEPETQFFEQKNIYYGFLGRALQGLKRHQEAVAIFERINSFDMDRNIPLYHGISLFNLGRLNEAEPRLREAVRLNERPEAWNLLGTIAAQRQDYAAAVEAFSRAVELAPSQQHYRENLVRAQALRESSR